MVPIRIAITTAVIPTKIPLKVNSLSYPYPENYMQKWYAFPFPSNVNRISWTDRESFTY